MIVPRTRLLVAVALVMLPPAAAAAAKERFAWVAVAAVCSLAPVVALDAVAGARRLRSFNVRLPDLVRLFERRETEIEVRVGYSRPGRVRVGVVWPEEFEGDEDLVLELPNGVTEAAASWRVTGLKRGRFLVDGARFEQASPMGFWNLRRSVEARSEVRVYPNLLLEKDSVAPLLLRKASAGLHVQRQVGRGREFEKLREYIPGDSFEDVHWKATARRGVPITKVYQVERTQEIYVIIDASRLSAREVDNGATVLERFVNAAMILGLAAEQQGDLFGLVAYSDRVLRFIRAKNGTQHYGVCRDALYSLQAEETTPDFEELCAFLRIRLRRRALLLFLTELDDPLVSESFSKQVHLLSRQHLVLANMLRPPTARPLFTGEEPKSVDEIYDCLGSHIQWRKLKELETALRAQGVRFSLLESSRIGTQLTGLYREVKQRQLL